MPEAPRFLCDEMLVGLARWLRAAGYDAATARNGEHDSALVAHALDDGRVLLTCEQRIPRDPVQHALQVVTLPPADVETQAAALTRALGLGWDAAPFSRCMEDNTPLEEAGAAALARVPPAAKALGGPFCHCPACDRIYWPGRHVFRMARRLRSFAETRA